MSQDGYILVLETKPGRFQVDHMDASCGESRELIGTFDNLTDAMSAANTFEEKEEAEGYAIEYGITCRFLSRKSTEI